MRLRVTTPLATVVEVDGVLHVRAEDASGAFGIRAGHADLVTVLADSVLTWRERDGAEGNVALRGGVLSVRGGVTVEVATRRAVRGTDLAGLLEQVRAERRAEAASRAAERGHVERLHVAAVHRICRYIGADAPEVPRVGGGRERR